MADALEYVLSLLDGVRRSNGQFVALCPAHDDRNPSLSVGIGREEQVLLNCFAGCKIEDIATALNLEMRDLWPESDPEWPRHPSLGSPIRAWTFHDAQGREHSKKFKFLPSGDEKKPFRFYHSGTWARPKDKDPVLYRLPRVLAAAPDETILLPEGEKDVVSVEKLGYIATTNAEGATTWKAEYTEALAGRIVVFLLDNDHPGYERLNEIGPQLKKAGYAVSYVELPGLKDGEDVSDYLARGGTKDQLDALIKNANAFLQPIGNPFAGKNSGEEDREGHDPVESVKSFIKTAKEFSNTPPPKTEYHLQGLFPKGAMVQITGSPKGSGKTTFLVHALSAIINGERFLGYDTEKTTALYLTEQGRAFESEYLESVGLADSDKLSILYSYQTAGYKWPDVARAAIEVCIERAIGILVVDTISDFAGLSGDGENSSGVVLEALKPLKHAAQKHGITVILVHHDRKGGGNVEDSGRGSNAYAQVVDAIINLRRSKLGDSVRELTAVGRYGDFVKSLVIEKTADGYENHGAVENLASLKAEKALLEHAPISEQEARKYEDLFESLPDTAGFGKTTLNNVVKRLAADGQLRTIGKGRKGDPIRYWRERGNDQERFFPATPNTIVEGKNTGSRNGQTEPSIEELFPPKLPGAYYSES